MKLADGSVSAFSLMLGRPGVDVFALPKVDPCVVVVGDARGCCISVLGERGVDVVERLLLAGSSRRSIVRFCRLAGRRLGVAEAAELVGLLELAECEGEAAS